MVLLLAGCIGDTPAADQGLDGPRTDTGPGAAPWVSVASTGRYFVKGAEPVYPLGFSMHGEHINLDYFGKATINGKQETRGQAVSAGQKVRRAADAGAHAAHLRLRKEPRLSPLP